MIGCSALAPRTNLARSAPAVGIELCGAKAGPTMSSGVEGAKTAFEHQAVARAIDVARYNATGDAGWTSCAPVTKSWSSRVDVFESSRCASSEPRRPHNR